jgi:hypothetical protein
MSSRVGSYAWFCIQKLFLDPELFTGTYFCPLLPGLHAPLSRKYLAAFSLFFYPHEICSLLEVPLLYCPQDRGCGHVPNALRAKRKPEAPHYYPAHSLYCPQDRDGTDVQTHKNATKAPLTGHQSTRVALVCLAVTGTCFNINRAPVVPGRYPVGNG